jgi:hypothetical protein
VSEHLCQGDWGGNFSKENSSLWQIWPKVSGFLFCDFLRRERPHVSERGRTCEDNCMCEGEIVARVTGSRKQAARVICTTCVDQAGCTIDDVNMPYSKFASWKGFFREFC